MTNRSSMLEKLRSAALAAAAALLIAAPAHASSRAAVPETMPRFSHVFVIVDENKDFRRIDGGADAPFLTSLARRYGEATNFYGEVHPSEANYVALLGGSTFGIHDDDAYFCRPGSLAKECPHAREPGYASHTVDAPHLGTQLEQAGLTWRGYYESIPAPGSLAVTAPDLAAGRGSPRVYAAKHSGFLNFASAQSDPHRADRLTGFDRLERDLARSDAPSFGLVVPNLCNDMHGMAGPGVPADCSYENLPGLIRRGDAAVSRIFSTITTSPVWRSPENVAVVVSFDEDDGTGREGCCGVTPGAPSNFGGGHIATIVVTNHSRGHVVDATPYNHYSLLRSIEDAFGLGHLGLAAASDRGVRDMTPLFAQ